MKSYQNLLHQRGKQTVRLQVLQKGLKKKGFDGLLKELEKAKRKEKNPKYRGIIENDWHFISSLYHILQQQLEFIQPS